MSKTYNLKSTKELNLILDEWFDEIKKHKIIYLIGDLGAGKTTFVKELAKKIGIKQNITSPSFNYMKTYDGLVHIDLYNYKGDIEEFEDYFDDNIIAIEWANLHNLTFKNVIVINCELNKDNTHSYRIEVN
ncbi:tRNA (adenosine(37)-N6)-threonylcarbamoyltransferase complex ATPase subunit type 1 TsaE [Mycoplasmopsis edwardii]|nr:tRNA (adenosine(37)-N6)-threonylcarbamoyltransferase complex ATPase subunit type 1 TsaE [Mycoplasmopsis edwardii]